MTEIEDQEQSERDVVELIRQTAGEWREIRMHVCAAAGALQATPSSDPDRPLRIPTRAVLKMRDLRRVMADSRQGAWLVADVVVPREGEATFHYDWMSKPDWPATGGKVSDHDDAVYLEDLNEFPRTPDNIPDWYPTPGSGSAAAAYADPAEDNPRTPAPLPRRGESPGELLRGLDLPFGVAVAAAGDVYVTDADRVVTVPVGAPTPQVLPVSGLSEPAGIAVDDTGGIYIADSLNNRVLVATASGGDAKELPLNGLDYPGGLAVDGAGTVYVTDRSNRQVLKLSRGAASATVLPFSGLRWLIDVAVDDAGAIYAADRAQDTADPVGSRVLMLAPDAQEPIEVAAGLQFIGGIAVDHDGNLYISEKVAEGRVLKLSGGTFSIVASRLQHPSGLAVDAAGNVYVAETPPETDEPFGGRVTKLAAP